MHQRKERRFWTQELGWTVLEFGVDNDATGLWPYIDRESNTSF